MIAGGTRARSVSVRAFFVNLKKRLTAGGTSQSLRRWAWELTRSSAMPVVSQRRAFRNNRLADWWPVRSARQGILRELGRHALRDEGAWRSSTASPRPSPEALGRATCPPEALGRPPLGNYSFLTSKSASMVSSSSEAAGAPVGGGVAPGAAPAAPAAPAASYIALLRACEACSNSLMAGLDLVDVVRLGRLADFFDRAADGRLVGIGEFLIVLLNELFHLEAHRIGLVFSPRRGPASACPLRRGPRLPSASSRCPGRSGRRTVSIFTFCSVPVPRSFAETFRMPSASMSKETSICGTPRGAGGMPSRLNCASNRLPAAISRSPW